MNFSNIDITELAVYYMRVENPVDPSTYSAYQDDTGKWIECQNDEPIEYTSDINTYISKAENIRNAISELHRILVIDNESDTMYHCYEVGKKFYGDKNLRNFFGDIYLILTLRTNEGPRLGVLIDILGREVFFNKVFQNMKTPIFWNKIRKE